MDYPLIAVSFIAFIAVMAIVIMLMNRRSDRRDKEKIYARTGIWLNPHNKEDVAMALAGVVDQNNQSVKGEKKSIAKWNDEISKAKARIAETEKDSDDLRALSRRQKCPFKEEELAIAE